MKKTKSGMTYYTKDDVKKLMKENKIPIKAFYKWMFGQTGPIADDGSLAYYSHDVERFIRYKGKAENEPLVEWD
jgi:hypothetical protein